jgi:small GTP-binding protein
MSEQFPLSIRLLTLGNGAAGKSSLINQYTTNEFDPLYPSTIGIDFRIKSVELQGIRLNIQIWDTAGQERFRTITRNYFRGAMGILLMYSITDKETFDNLERWHRDILFYAEDEIPIALIGTKSDLETQRQVSREEGEKFAADKGLLFFETSAKTGSNVAEAIEALATVVLQKEMVRKLEKSINIAPVDDQPRSCCMGPSRAP